MNNILTNTTDQNFENLSTIYDWLKKSRSYTSFCGKRQITSGDLTLSLNQVVKKIEEMLRNKTRPVQKIATLLDVAHNPGDIIFIIQKIPKNQTKIASQIVVALESSILQSSRNLNWFTTVLLKIRELKCLNLSPSQHLKNAKLLFNPSSPTSEREFANS